MSELVRAILSISRKSRRGATALEYALVLAFVAVAVLAAMTTLGGNLQDTIADVGGDIETKVGGATFTSTSN